MRVLIAPDSFKGSLRAVEAADAMARGVLAADPGAVVDSCPVADGGEGTVAALVRATGGETVVTRVTGPLGESVDAVWGLLGDARTAVIEMAAAAGLGLVPADRRDPIHATTFGVGELILAALGSGRPRILVGLGGSATCDGGRGMAMALGDTDLGDVEIVGACDVTSPLLGPRGAARLYSPQKGATPADVAMLEERLSLLAEEFPDVDRSTPGAGAAGGLGFGLVAFGAARLVSGIEIVLDAVGFADRLRGADLVLTGEGRYDTQTSEGKAVDGVLRAAQAAAVPAVVLAGEIEGDAPKGSRALIDVAGSREAARRDAARHLEELARRVGTETRTNLPNPQNREGGP